MTDSKVQRKQVKCHMIVNYDIISLQIDIGSTVNILPRKYLAKNQAMHKTDIILEAWNKDKYQPIGHCRNIVKNLKKIYK